MTIKFTVAGCLLALGCLGVSVVAQSTAHVKVDLGKRQHKIDRRIYGHFVEHFGRVVQGGLWAELLRNRKFYPHDPDRTSVSEPWKADSDRAHVSYAIDEMVTLNGVSSQRVMLSGNVGGWRGISQTGFDILAHRDYVAYAWIKGTPASKQVSLRLESPDGKISSHQEFQLQSGDWRKYEVRMRVDRDLRPAVFRVAFDSPGFNWIGAVSLMPADNVDGVRKDVLELVKSLKPPVIRWPGGGYSDHYDWRKAIGPRDRRAPQIVLPYGHPGGYENGIDTDDFGTDEFMKFCRLVGAEPYLTVNYGTGTAELAAEWVEYCNGPVSTSRGAMRAANGHAEPYSVRLWSVGNELWGPFEPGYSSAETYGTWFLPFAKAMRAVDPDIRITAVGSSLGPDNAGWNNPVIQTTWEQTDFISIHHYFPGDTLPYVNRPLDIYHAIVAQPVVAEQHIRQLIRDMDAITGGKKQINIAFDEWNQWEWQVPELLRPAPRSDINRLVDVVVSSSLENNHCERDALFAARMLHTFMRCADRLPIANRTHLVNSMGAIRTSDTGAFLTATGAAMQLYSNHSGSVLLGLEQQSPLFDVPDRGWTRIPYLDAVVTASEDGSQLYLHLLNVHATEPLQVEVDVTGGTCLPQATFWRIASEDFMSRNDFDHSPVAVKRHDFSIPGASFKLLLPPHSMTTLEAAVAKRTGSD